MRRSRLSEQLIDEVFGFGPLQPLLADPTITEIMVNGPGDVFFERQGRLVRSDGRFRAKLSFGRLSIACSGRSAGAWTSRRLW